MLLDSLNLGGYGLFVWPAFVLTFMTFFVLYFKTRKEFVKQEILYLSEFRQSKAIEITPTEEKKAVLGNPIL